MTFKSSKTSSMREPSDSNTTMIDLDGWRFTVEDKWKVVSQLQKSIRQGDAVAAAQAVRWGMTLDAAYLRHRLAVIAFEDVAGGSPEVVAVSMQAGWTKKAIEEQGGMAWLEDQVRRWAVNPKDRLANDWLACIRWKETYEQRWGEWSRQSLSEARAIAVDSDAPWWARGLAAWRMAGSDRFPHEVLGKVEGDWPAWIETNASLGVDDATLACMQAGAKSQRECSPVFLGLVAQARRLEAATLVEPVVLNLGQVGPWKSSALDKHTAEGRRALGHWWRHDATLNAWGRQQGWSDAQAQEVLGRLQFWMEGGVLNQRWDYPTLRTVDQDVKRRFLQHWAVSGADLFAHAGQHPERWHAARLAVVNVRLSEIAPMVESETSLPARATRRRF